jgi:mannose-6-phosphate isomerase-like protein (cupin superfamily)
MQVRRVVTGCDPDGRAVVASDSPVPRSHDFQHIPGMSTAMVWATRPDEPIRGDGTDPTPRVPRQVPEPGGSCFVVVRFPPDTVFASDAFDPAAADAEQRAVSPGLAELFEPDQPGMHTTETVDYLVVLDGQIWLELDDGQLVELRQGDTVVQNGTRHAWRNLGTRPATLAVVMLGARRPDANQIW